MSPWRPSSTKAASRAEAGQGASTEATPKASKPSPAAWARMRALASAGGGGEPSARGAEAAAVISGAGAGRAGHATRSTIMRLMPAMALAGFSPLGHTWAQFMMVWQRYSLKGSSSASSRAPAASSRVSDSQR